MKLPPFQATLSVSYTHLDVYKRQTKDQQISSKENFEDEKLDNPFINRLIKEVEYLKIDKDKIISTKDQQISSKDQQIEKLTNLLDQQQRLALQDKKLLEEYKAENDNLKALKMPSEETEFKHLDNQYKDEVNALKEMCIRDRPRSGPRIGATAIIIIKVESICAPLWLS